MIIINRALSQIKKGERPKEKKEGPPTQKENKNGQCYYPFSTLVLQSSAMIFMTENLVLSLSYTSGNFSLWNLACIFQQWASSNALGLREQASWMHTHLVLLLSFHTFIALVHPLHGNPYPLH